MKIRNLEIQNFRGIKSLVWSPAKEDNLICFIGHGDSSKSTILKAIEYALSPKWNLPLTDSDFHNCSPSNEIQIELTIGEIPDELAIEFVAFYRYFNNGQFRNLGNMQSGDEKVITIVLKIDENLDPFWGVLDSDGDFDDENILKASQRKLFNMLRLDKESSNVFNWKYDSPLMRIINKDKKKEIKTKLVEVGRTARDGFDKSLLPQEIKDQAEEIETIAKSFAVGHDDFNANVDIFSADTICLHRGEIPFYMLGEGSRKIAALSIGKYLIKKSVDDGNDGGFIIFDEIENSLEPHRLRYIISSFERDSKNSKFQTFLSTHSSITVEELGTKGLYVVRNNNGNVDIHKISSECIGAVRSQSEALFAKKIVICEGKTEFGLMKAFSRYWAKEDQRKFPPQHIGVVLLDGKGSSMQNYLEKFKKMGYEISVFKDNDTNDPKISNKASQLGADVFEYPHGYRTEKIIFEESPKAVQDNIVDYFNMCREDSEQEIIKESSYNQTTINTIEIKLHDAKRKDNSKGIFRRIDTAEDLGSILIENWNTFTSSSEFKKTIEKIEKWIYD